MSLLMQLEAPYTHNCWVKPSHTKWGISLDCSIPLKEEETSFDILSDTPECPISRDSNSGGTVSAEECDGYGGDNLMFWTTWSSSSQAAGKTQETLSSYQEHVLKYSPIANLD